MTSYVCMVLVALMAGIFSTYLVMKGLKKVWKPDPWMVVAIGCGVADLAELGDVQELVVPSSDVVAAEAAHDAWVQYVTLRHCRHRQNSNDAEEHRSNPPPHSCETDPVSR